MHVSFIHIFLPQFLTDGLVNVLLFEVGHLCVCLGTLGACVRGYFWYLWFGGGCICLYYDGWLTAIAVGCPKILILLLLPPGELVRGFWIKIKDITF